MLGAAFSLLSIGWSYWVLSSNPEIATNTLLELLIAGKYEASTYSYHNLHISVPVRFSQFTFGLMAAWFVLNRPHFFENMSKYAITALGILAISAVAYPLLYNPYTVPSDLQRAAIFIELLLDRNIFAAGIALTIILLQANKMPRLKHVLSLRFLQPVARYSFSMYLLHPAFVYIGVYFFVGLETVPTVSALQYVGVAMVTLTGSIAFGWITWRFIESPAIRFGRKHFR